MSSIAQEESRSISENVTWGQRKRFADGKVSLPYKRFLGYEKGEDDLPKIVESEARVVRLIYALFLQGKTAGLIAKHLTEQKIPTPAGKIQPWVPSTVSSILSNEKYAGNALLQKKFTEDFLTKKQRVNLGEVPQYFVENSHPAIVSVETYDLVQAEIKRRKEQSGRRSGQHCFSGKVICGNCSNSYGPKTWHSTSQYRRTIWQCNHKYEGGDKCPTPHLYEDDLKRLFVEAFNRLYSDRAGLVDDYNEIIGTLTDTAKLEKKAAALAEECAVVTELMRKCVDENAHTAQDQDAYHQRYDGLASRYQAVKKQLDGVSEGKLARVAKRESMSLFIASLGGCGGALKEFDEPLWYATVETVTIHEMVAVFSFKDGTVIDVEI